MLYRFYTLSMAIQYSHVYIIFKIGHYLVALDLNNTAIGNSAYNDFNSYISEIKRFEKCF